MNLYETLKSGEQYLQNRGIADAATDAWLLLEYVTGIGRARFLAERTAPVTEQDRQRYEQLLAKRGRHIPLQHLTGEQEFMGFSFQVNAHVLIPRQDTETLVEEALRRLKRGYRVLDLCTGSGCIAISLARLGREALAETSDRTKDALPGKASDRAETVRLAKASDRTENVLQVEASDLSEDALAVADVNNRRLEAGVRLIHSDLFENLSGPYDVIVSNPPYIRTDVIEALSEEVRLHEPRLALDGREDGLYFYRKIIDASHEYLVPGGWLLFEIGFDQGSDVERLMRASGFREVRTVKDLAGLDRVVTGNIGGNSCLTD